MENNDSGYTERLTATINEAYRKMLERKARLGEMVYTNDCNGVACLQRAIDVYHRVYGELPALP